MLITSEVRRHLRSRPRPMELSFRYRFSKCLDILLDAPGRGIDNNLGGRPIV